jgi:solute carrier family 25, member 33/36
MFIVKVVFVVSIKVIDRGFSKIYRCEYSSGISASYLGVSETIVHFVMYEQIKAQLQLIQISQNRSHDDPDLFNFFSYLGAAACSKSCASTLCYPHEVIRTRLREEGNKYRTLIQTFRTVILEEGLAGLYRGLLTHLIRQIPVRFPSCHPVQSRLCFFI